MMTRGNGNGKNGGNGASKSTTIRCAIYTRKSTEEGLDQEFNSLDAQREACEAYIASQRHAGWIALSDRYDDGGFTGANMNRPGLQKLLQHVQAGQVDSVIVYKVDRLSRSLLDFARMIELLEKHSASFVSVTQSFNTATSMGRLSLHMLLSFAQYEREIIGERIRDKVAASKMKGKYMGGTPPLGYDVDREAKRLVVNPDEAKLVRHIFNRFLSLGSVTKLARELNDAGHTTKAWVTAKGRMREGRTWNKSHLYRLLNNPILIGRVSHKGETFPGEHEAIIEKSLWDKVQKALADNTRSHPDETRAKTPMLLKGLIRCGHCGASMGATFARKDGKTYRYYLCLQARKSGYEVCPVRTVAAGEVENAVLARLREMIGSTEMIEKAGIISNERAASFRNMANLWDELYPGEHARIVRMLIEKVIVYEERLELSIRKDGLLSLAAELGDEAARPMDIDCKESGTIDVPIPMTFKRRNGRKKIVLPPGVSERTPNDDSHDPVVIAVARAHRWLELLESEKIASIADLARSLELDGSYVHRMLSLTSLSPEIITNIIDEKGAGYSLAQLTKVFPVLWEEQKENLHGKQK
jgi:site-specific DNA recombinase